MPLDFDFRDIENWKEVCRDKNGQVKGVTEALIWATMTIGISDITHKNYEEFHRRLLEFDICNDTKPVVTYHSKENGANFGHRHITLEEIRKHIGLSTNAGSEVTRAAWEKRLKKVLAEKVESIKSQETKEKETA